jgi:hypothetical protein
VAFDVSPPHDCPDCPRLAAFRAANRAAFPDWWNAPVPTFGDANARVAIVGLAPGLRGANRTGRPFTGDYAGDLLYSTLIEFGFASGVYDRRPDDGLTLVDCAIINAVRCVPPQNKPSPQEIATCRRYLTPAISALPRLKILKYAARAQTDPGEISLRAWRATSGDDRRQPLRQLSLLALQHQYRRADGGDVPPGLRLGPRRTRPHGCAGARRGVKV